MIGKLGWTLWAVVPALFLAFHFGPGQTYLKRDQAVAKLKVAQEAEAEANRLQEIAYQLQFETMSASERSAASKSPEDAAMLATAEKREQEAYALASDAWKKTSELYQEVESLLDETGEANQVRLLRSRALVRAGEVFNGIEELQATLDSEEGKEKNNPKLAEAIREELAAAHYIGARLLREEGRSADVWKLVSETSRQQYRFLAENSSETGEKELASNLQRNLERVLDLEQLDHTELVGRPLPKDSPRGRRPGDGQPGKRPGRGPRPDGDQPGNGASGMMEIGDGW